MSWLILVISSVLLFSVESLLNRVLMKNKDSDPYTQTLVFTFMVGFWLFIILLFRGGFGGGITLNQLPYLLLVIVLVILGGIGIFSGFKYLEASEHTIILTSSRLWIVLGAVLILGEQFSIRKFLGTILIILGVIITVWRKHKFAFNKGVFYVIGAAFFYGWGEIFSFHLLRSMDSVDYMFVITMLIALVMVVIKPKSIKKLSFYKNKSYLANILIVTIFDTVANLLVFFAYQKERNALQIGPISATQTIVTVILTVIFLKETQGLGRKILGAVAATIGTIVLL